ncbi:DUF418 domain-containing protein [Streptomyces sp. MUM 203J]|uniref:DUF418 domain-containing protein n=1 Tax=Streptomyces sp. MUM 203J TaxID=2791990 RepID=UPI001F03B240|nr:DUF418 domain-containing protein [Streptomyces sp. MUM 203J]MCH0541917.1 DUF418 domain-containing protein [Streptomyces sp. MUM 203J]
MTTTTGAATPQTAVHRRLPLLDVLRGTAILGTLMTNVWVFTSPGAEWGVLQGSGGTPGFGSVPDGAETLFRLLADGKFLSLLTILFGAGLAIQHAAAERRGEPWPGRYRWRALFLFVEGTVHFLLVFAWDVLMGYAVTALYVAWLLSRSERARRRAMWWAAGVHVTVMGLLSAALALGDGDPAGGGGGVSPSVVELYAHGSWFEQIAFRVDNALALRIEPVLTFALLVFLFLLGVRLLRAGAFGADAVGRRLRARMLAWGLGLGVPLSVVCVLAGDAGFLAGRYVAAPLVAVGYMGLIGAVVDRLLPQGPDSVRPGPVTGAVMSLGRMALSGYVVQNVLCVLVSYGIGLGLAARLGDTWRPWGVMGLWAAVCAVLLVGANWWLRRFEAGPLEGVQRSVLRRVLRG